MLRFSVPVALLAAVAAVACDDGESAVDTCSTGNVVDDIDDGTGADAEKPPEAPADLSY